MSDRELKVLKKKRAVFKGQLTNFKNHVETFPETLNYTLLRTKLTRIEKLFAEVLEVQSEIECLDLETDYTEERSDLEDDFDECASHAKDLLQAEPLPDPVAPATEDHGPTATGVVVESDIRLPHINLPTFSGAYDEWPGFADQFRSTVHNNTSINDGKKLTYLRSCVCNDAARTIQSLGNSPSNYPVAWAILQRTYHQPAIVANKHIGALLSISANPRTHRDLHRFLADAEAHYEALKTSGHLTIDNLIVFILISQLDAETAEKWKESKPGDFPTVQDLLRFLRDRCKIIAPCIPDAASRQLRPKTATTSRSANPPQKPSAPVGSKLVFSTLASPRCAICTQEHYTSGCEKLTRLNVRDRQSLVKQYKLCVNCLRPGHPAVECRSSNCKKCGKRHHTLLHVDFEPKQSSGPSSTQSETANKPREPSQPPATCCSAIVPSEVLLFTAIVNIQNNKGEAFSCRVLLDSCSQTNFLTNAMVDKLNLVRKPIDIPLTGINSMESRVKYYVHARIQSNHNNFSDKLTFLTVPRIAEKLPSRTLKHAHLDIPKNIKLADPQYYKPADIDGLLGAELFCKLLCVGQISIKGSNVSLQKTQLGWVISGSTRPNTLPDRSSCHVTTASNLENDIAKFWECEEGINTRPLSPEEAECERHYVATATRDPESGRYTVSLPFRQDNPRFEDSYAIALKRFYALERSLARDADLKKQYTNFLREYEAMSHMTEVSVANHSEGYFLPHHHVTKITSLTTKLRVVFDASARSNNGLSLNDTLLTGPTIQEDVFALVTRFRSHPYVLTADIAKMYRQVLVHPRDRKYQRIIWRENQTDPLKVYELNTVTYGTSSAPYLAIRTLAQLASDESKLFPDATRTLRNDFYVDDLLTGSHTIDETLRLRDDLMTVTERGGFHLRQWASNERAVLADLAECSDSSHLCLDVDATTKTLGVYWNASDDTIEYSINSPTVTERTTKRSILSQIAKLYDPLGLLAPVIVKAKIIMQHLWQLKLEWDESIPSSIHTAWSQFSQQLANLETLKISRKIVLSQPTSIQLHGFCDASERAYGACIYLRSVNNNGDVHVQLVTSKTRVAPLKTISLPRLELCAAVLLTKLYTAAQLALKLSFGSVCFWSDSTIALHWINSSPHTLKTFVGNRVSEIQRHTMPQQWHHVPSAENPADLASRGSTPSEFLVQQTFWLGGPTWLSQTENHWPATILPTIEIPEQRGVITLLTTVERHDILVRYSDIGKLQRVLAHCFRFIHNATNKSTKRSGTLTITELQNALTRILSLVQREVFSDELQRLNTNASKTKGKSISKFAPLNPFIDRDGLIRVGGRLTNADLPFCSRHPVLLPACHHVTQLIIREVHTKQYHAGSQATLNAVRENYWPIHGMTAVKTVVNKCVRCRRVKPIVYNHEMGNLPSTRVTFKRPFLVSGVDYCGPFYVRERRHRNLNKVKVYVAVFVCFATKSVHLEIVENLTSEAFLAALRRFFARRGKPSDMYSDNATTFVGAQRELHKLIHTVDFQQSIETRLKQENVRWHYIPPRSPHFGGLWEAAVRSFKHHFYRVVGDTLLSYEALLTCVTEIEGILNSRPLTALSTDPNDLSALTPAHFLIGDTFTSFPEHDLTDIKPARLSIWQQAQQLKQHFWKRWYKDYLHQLTVRRKWHSGDPTGLDVGTLVTIKEDNIPPMRWPLGRVIQTHPGDDGVTRVATLRTASGECKRSVKRLSPLLWNADHEDN